MPVWLRWIGIITTASGWGWKWWILMWRRKISDVSTDWPMWMKELKEWLERLVRRHCWWFRTDRRIQRCKLRGFLTDRHRRLTFYVLNAVRISASMTKDGQADRLYPDARRAHLIRADNVLPPDRHYNPWLFCLHLPCNQVAIIRQININQTDKMDGLVKLSNLAGSRKMSVSITE